MQSHTCTKGMSAWPICMQRFPKQAISHCGSTGRFLWEYTERIYTIACFLRVIDALKPQALYSLILNFLSFCQKPMYLNTEYNNVIHQTSHIYSSGSTSKKTHLTLSKILSAVCGRWKRTPKCMITTFSKYLWYEPVLFSITFFN